MKRPTLLGTFRWAWCAFQGHPLTEMDDLYDIHRCACGAKKKTGEELVDGGGYDPFDRYFGAHAGQSHPGFITDCPSIPEDAI